MSGRDAVVGLASELLAVEGHEDHPANELDVAQFVARWLRNSGVSVELQPVESGRANVVAVVRGQRPGPVLLLNAHLDTVPPYGMTDALRPRVRGERLYGRGAVDMKGAMAAMLLVVRDVAARSAELSGELVFAGVAGEENGSPGMQELVRNGLRADFAVVGEPTGLRVARAHKGAMWIEVRFTGVAAHGSTPERGVNAIHHAAEFVELVRRDLAPRLRAAPHPLLGPATINVGVVNGGDRPPMVPAHCVVQLDRRWLPGETYPGVLTQVRELVDEMSGADPGVQASVSELPATSSFPHVPLDCPEDNAHLRHLAGICARRLGYDAEPVGVQFWTDGALLADRTGIPTVVCGPGDIAQAHSLEEWVSVDQLEAATAIYRQLAYGMLAAGDAR
ncbi:MAG: ArgE/DapE family deacylase [Streptosporangiales bacterium]|nr:ArgE/DapE family deacylase [Streptosporangiales bacterium]